MVIVGFITLFMFALVGFGPRFLEKIFPKAPWSGLKTMMALAAC